MDATYSLLIVPLKKSLWWVVPSQHDFSDKPNSIQVRSLIKEIKQKAQQSEILIIIIEIWPLKKGIE